MSSLISFSFCLAFLMTVRRPIAELARADHAADGLALPRRTRFVRRRRRLQGLSNLSHRRTASADGNLRLCSATHEVHVACPLGPLTGEAERI